MLVFAQFREGFGEVSTPICTKSGLVIRSFDLVYFWFGPGWNFLVHVLKENEASKRNCGEEDYCEHGAWSPQERLVG